MGENVANNKHKCSNNVKTEKREIISQKFKRLSKSVRSLRFMKRKIHSNKSKDDHVHTCSRMERQKRPRIEWSYDSENSCPKSKKKNNLVPKVLLLTSNILDIAPTPIMTAQDTLNFTHESHVDIIGRRSFNGFNNSVEKIWREA